MVLQSTLQTRLSLSKILLKLTGVQAATQPLAREQVWGDDRVCERCGTPVIKKDLNQWFFKTTDYAEKLLNFDGIDWPERVRTLCKPTGSAVQKVQT